MANVTGLNSPYGIDTSDVGNGAQFVYFGRNGNGIFDSNRFQFATEFKDGNGHGTYEGNGFGFVNTITGEVPFAGTVTSIKVDFDGGNTPHLTIDLISVPLVDLFDADYAQFVALVFSGADRMTGSDFDDRLDGHAGADEMRGGKGDDVYVVDEAGDMVIEQFDTLHDPSSPDFIDYGVDEVFAFVDYTLGDNVENLRFGPGSSGYVGKGNELDNVIRGEGKADELHGLGGDDTIIGESGDDMLYGGDDSDLLKGQKGHDRAWGGHGDDRMEGANGRDRMWGNDDADRMRGGRHDDRLFGGNDNDRLWGEDHADRLFGGRGHDRLYGGKHDDRLNGDRGRDLLEGGNGRDRLNGGEHDDRLFGGKHDDRLNGDRGRDLLEGGNGKDRLNGGDQNDRLLGGNHADRLDGGRGNDKVVGGNGHDFLSGGKGRDLLIGGNGRDTFQFDRGDGFDKIRGFSLRHDEIEIGRGAGRFADLDISQQGRHALVEFANVRILLLGVDADDLGARHFDL